jgi:hypothetical protein
MASFKNEVVVTTMISLDAEELAFIQEAIRASGMQNGRSADNVRASTLDDVIADATHEASRIHAYIHDNYADIMRADDRSLPI